MSPVRVVAYAAFTAAEFAALLLFPAGTVGWWRAWVFIGMLFAGTVFSTLSVLRVNPDVVTERRKPILQKGQPAADKVLVLLLVATFLGVVVLIPFDVFRFRLLPRPGPIVSALGLLLLAGGWWLITLALRANAFAAAVVEHMEERGHTVVDRGAYSVVRHPMYAGAVLFLVGAALWLESTAAALFSLTAVVVLAARILVEERFLVAKLPGYDAYRRRVRWRLVPLVW